MKLVYTDGGREVRIGDTITLLDGETIIIRRIDKPHKPSSTGRVQVGFHDTDYEREFFPVVVGAEWIEREDQG
jgi:hypothetical protein